MTTQADLDRGAARCRIIDALRDATDAFERKDFDALNAILRAAQLEVAVLVELRRSNTTGPQAAR